MILDGHITARRYTDDILRTVVCPFMSSHPDVTVHQQDNARPHASRFTQEFMKQSDMHIMQWLLYSPYQSPV